MCRTSLRFSTAVRFRRLVRQQECGRMVRPHSPDQEDQCLLPSCLQARHAIAIASRTRRAAAARDAAAGDAVCA